ncbi:MAG: S24 family peptidase [Candidatus Thioglobus sp.]|nr:MAG: S24 family peptidase [Candidatus Thioglobus sp.]KAA0448958.1 MAG: S24 family peptidase [Candidatus Thioglobus sp.]
MSEIITPKELLESSCSTNSEPFALQNLGSYMEPEFSENCILIIDPGMKIHPRAYAVVRFEGELYFRQYIERGASKFLVPLNTEYDEIELKNEFETIGCVVQQKQRKQQALHYYHLNLTTKKMDFSVSGKAKAQQGK